ncbi:MAG: hypothetical protein GY906_27645 [bacterium]|nr:hypothetical protein [bacterium]
MQHLYGPVGFVTASNLYATAEPDEPTEHSSFAHASLWWTWQAPATGKVTFDASGSNFNAELAVYNGKDHDNLELREPNTNRPGNRTSQLTVPVVRDAVYYIVIDTVDGSRGEANLHWLFEPGKGAVDPVKEKIQSH